MSKPNCIEELSLVFIENCEVISSHVVGSVNETCLDSKNQMGFLDHPISYEPMHGGMILYKFPQVMIVDDSSSYSLVKRRCKRRGDKWKVGLLGLEHIEYGVTEKKINGVTKMIAADFQIVVGGDVLFEGGPAVYGLVPEDTEESIKKRFLTYVQSLAPRPVKYANVYKG